MSNGMHSVVAIDPINTTPTQELGNDCSGDIKDEFGMCTGSNRQDSIAGLSSRYLLGSQLESSIAAEFDLLWRLRKYLVLLGVLAVSVTYNAGLTPPGGFWALNKDGHDAGDPVLHVFYAARFEVFFYCNATAFAASLVLVILLLSKSVTRHRIWLRSMQLTMILDLFSLLGAYAAGSCRAPKSSIYIWILVFAVFVYVGIHILISIRVIPETFSEKVETVVKGILSKWGVHDMRVRRSHLEKDVFPKGLEKDFEDARKFILMLATFAATITYQAGLNPPGGFWAENEHGSNKLRLPLPPYKHPPATSVLRSKYLHRYNIFVSFNSTSFVASLVTIILLLSPELSRQGIRSKAVNVCVVADLLGLIVAYAAGCCRSVHTSFYVMLITVIVWICFAILAGAFVCTPGADWLKRIKDLNCVDTFGRIFSLELGRNKPGNAAQDNSRSIDQHTSDLETSTPEEDSASEPEHRVPKIKEVESHGEHHCADRQRTENIEDDVPNSEHHLVNDQHSEKLEDQFTDHQSVAKDAMPNTGQSSIQCQQATNTEGLEDQFTDHQSVAKDAVANTGHSSCQQANNTKGGMSSSENQSADSHQVTNKMQQSSPTDELKIAVMLDSDCTEVTNNLAVQKLPCDDIGSSEIELVETKTTIVPSENGDIDSNEGDPSQDINKENADGDPTLEHLKKTRTYILLLAILAVSLTYQSGLNPPGGFWSRTENNHSAGDPILEDMHHRRYIAFFYLNAVAFVASLVMLIMLLNKRMSNKVTKRFALQTAMIVDLLTLTGAYVMGSSRKTSNSIYISLLVCLVLSYVAIHVLIATHVIPNGWKKLVAQKLKYFWWPKSHQLGQNQTGDDEKDWERRCNLLLMLAVLAATVTYQAGMNPPGSVWSDDEEISGTPGDPILQHNHSKRYDVFYYSNSVTFVSSVVITILLVNKESCEHGIKSYALRVCLVVGLVGLLIAYAAGSCRKAKESIYLIIIAVAVLMSLVIQVLLLSSTHDTVGGPLSKFVKRLLKRLFRLKEVSKETVSERQGSSDRHEKKKKKRHKYLMLLAILAASITYQAGLNPPGGFWPDGSNHVAGNPVLHDIHPWRYRTFFCFNNISFMASIVVIMFLLKKSVRKKDVPLEVLHLIMILDLLALMTAFAAGSCRKFRTSVYVYGLVVAVLIYLVLAIGVSSSIAKWTKRKKQAFLLRHPERA